MTKSRFLSAALIATAVLATPAMARTSHVNSRHLAVDANASASPSAHSISGAVSIRTQRVGALAAAPSDGGICDAGDDPRICSKSRAETWVRPAM
jgi:hypothetical protein